MTALHALLAAVRHDPVYAYSLLAAGLLAVVSLGTGLGRLDLAVLVRPRVLLRVLAAVVAAFLLALAAAALAAASGASEATRTLAGMERFPLYLVALAYGPTVGLVAAGLVAGLQANSALPGAQQALLALELAVLGWLAIYPSPRTSRWAGPFDAALAYLLAWGTGGLALLDARSGSVTAASVWAQQQPMVPGIVLTVALLALLPPGVYRRAFPHSRTDPRLGAPDARRPSPAEGGREASQRDPMKLTFPDLPRILARGRRDRELEPLPSFLREEDPDSRP